MPKKKTSRRVAKIAAKQLKSKQAKKPAKITAGSALSQYEPKRKKKR
jgi:hypothetical protein